MLSPRDITIDEGVYYLLVRPVVEAGINATNATVSVTSIAAQCVYWDELKLNWSDYGCRVRSFTWSFTLHRYRSVDLRAVLDLKALFLISSTQS